MNPEVQADPCPECGGPVIYLGRGRRPIYCSARCRTSSPGRPAQRPAPPPEPNLQLQRVLRHAERLCEERGWSRASLNHIKQWLRRLLADHPAGERVHVSALEPLRKDKPAKRIAIVLADLDLLDDNRVPAIRLWIDRRTGELPAGFRSDVHDWLTWLHTGDKRHRGRTDTTLYCYFGKVRPVLEELAGTRSHLREITTADLQTIVDRMHGRPRGNTIVALRSLFRFAARHRRVFANPAAHLHCGRAATTYPLPLDQATISTAARAANTAPTTSVWRLVLALTVIHAARPANIRALLLDDVDLPNRRLTLNGHRRPLDDLTYAILDDYLSERRSRWPHTPNPHLLISRITAGGTEPVSTYFLKQHLLVRHGVRLDQLRADRVLEEALAQGPDPLHLTALFGFSPWTAIRFAEAARKVLSASTRPDENNANSSPSSPRNRPGPTCSN